MSRTLAALALLLPTTALAQEAPGAPGECTTCIAPAPVAKPVDLQRRFGVSARAVSLSLAPTGDGGDALKSEYGGGGVAVSYRISRRWEVALALDALDAPEGPDLHSTSITARFHLTPHRRWDWYVLAGIGMLHEAKLEGEERAEDPGRGRFHLGGGLARRWRSWSLAAELHSVAVAPRSDEAMSTALSTTTPTTMRADEGLSGGELTIAATFFF
jgi:hypothetical protein